VGRKMWGRGRKGEGVKSPDPVNLKGCLPKGGVIILGGVLGKGG